MRPCDDLRLQTICHDGPPFQVASKFLPSSFQVLELGSASKFRTLYPGRELGSSSKSLPGPGLRVRKIQRTFVAKAQPRVGLKAQVFTLKAEVATLKARAAQRQKKEAAKLKVRQQRLAHRRNAGIVVVHPELTEERIAKLVQLKFVREFEADPKVLAQALELLVDAIDLNHWGAGRPKL